MPRGECFVNDLFLTQGYEFGEGFYVEKDGMREYYSAARYEGIGDAVDRLKVRLFDKQILKRE